MAKLMEPMLKRETGIPMATDIAFALSVYLVGNHDIVFKIVLTKTLAVIDDLG
jgi:Na+/H+ antiporter NhaA